MPTRDLVIVNALGLHARAAAKFVERAQTFEANISLSIATPQTTEEQDPGLKTEPDWVDGKSIMGVMLLAASKGTEIRLRAEGEDARAALDAIDALIADKFGEGS